ncbi:MAG: NADase-type glycan-binding domain-containing protein [Egibacteraceae bacterium]
MSCPRCGQLAPAPGRLNFCTGCGYDLRGARGDAPGGFGAPALVGQAVALPPIVPLGECPHCGASNAASRRVCGRCRSTLDETAVPAPPALPPAEEADSHRLLLLVTLIAGFVICSVLLTLLGARGIGILRTPSEGALHSGFVRLAVTGVAVPPAPATAGGVRQEPANLIDGDPGTAWCQGTRSAGGEWVELTLDRPTNVARLLVWNGYQKDDQFGDNGRVRTLLIDAAGRRFSVDLLDVRGSQSVDLPGSVLTTRIRLTVAAVYQGDRYPDIALSEIQVYARPART